MRSLQSKTESESESVPSISTAEESAEEKTVLRKKQRVVNRQRMRRVKRVKKRFHH